MGKWKKYKSYKSIRSLSAVCFYILSLALITVSCSKKDSSSAPSISSFDNYLFTKTHAFGPKELERIEKAYPVVINEFFYFILGIDTLQINAPSALSRINDYTSKFSFLSDTLKTVVKNFDEEANLLGAMIERYKKQFEDPSFRLDPIYAYTGPIDAPVVGLFRTWIGANVTLLAGENFPLYKTYEFQSIFPSYLRHRLHKRYLPYFVMQQILMDKYPLEEKTHSLIEKIINEGKYRYILQRLSSDKNDDRICMFTPEKLKWCAENEKAIWNNIKANARDLYTIDPATIRNYIGEAPKTEGMPDQSPGNIGCWVGLRIVSAFMEKNPIRFKELMYTNPYQLFQQSEYNP